MPRKKTDHQFRFDCYIADRKQWQNAADAHKIAKGNLSEWMRLALNAAAASQLKRKGKGDGKKPD